MIVTQFAGVVELVDTEDLKSSGLNSCTGSSPVSGSKNKTLTVAIAAVFLINVIRKMTVQTFVKV